MSWGAVAAPVLGTLMGQFTQESRNRNQVNQQRELNKVNMESAKEMGQFNYEQQMKMWKDTNVGAQVDELKKAGMSVGNMYGGSGAGGMVSAAPASMGSSQADGAAATAGTATQMGALGMQVAAQTALLGAQKENVEADTANKLAGAGNQNVQAQSGAEDVKAKEFENKIRELVTSARRADNEIDRLAAEDSENKNRYNEAETKNKVMYDGKLNTDSESPIAKSMKASQEMLITTLENAKKTGDVLEATKAIEGFKAELAKRGISPDTPWYAKLLSDIATKLGYNPLDWIKK